MPNEFLPFVFRLFRTRDINSTQFQARHTQTTIKNWSGSLFLLLIHPE